MPLCCNVEFHLRMPIVTRWYRHKRVVIFNISTVHTEIINCLYKRFSRRTKCGSLTEIFRIQTIIGTSDINTPFVSVVYTHTLGPADL